MDELKNQEESAKMYQTIKIDMKNSKQVVWEKDEWDDYLYDEKFFVIKKNNKWVGFYNLDEVVFITMK